MDDAVRISACLAMALALGFGATMAVGADTAAQGQSNDAAPAPAQPSEPIATRAQVQQETGTEEPQCPVSFSLTYALYSDYVFRGLNLSEYRGEGREKPNHQLTVSIGYDLSSLGQGDWGTLGFDAWFEWYAAQKQLNPEEGGQNCQEVDYTIWWSHAIDPIATDVTLGYVFYNYLNLGYVLRQDRERGNNNDNASQEWNIKFAHNDAWMWKSLLPNNDDGVLNPFFLFAHDVGAFPGVWMEWGISHDFAIPGVEGLTVTPSWKQAAQGSYYKHGFFLAGDELALKTTYDLTPILQLPKWAGTVSIGGELHYWNAYHQMEADPDPGRAIEYSGHDEFWGGLTVNWSWGG